MTYCPNITVVTICLNAVQTVQRTIDSVVTQDYDKFEYIVVDGGSTDGTTDVIVRNASKITRWISEPDRGISDAFNKAINMSSGEYHIVVNAGDTLCPGALSSLARATGSGIVCVSGRSEVVHSDGVRARIYRAEPERLVWRMSVPHGGSLVSTPAWREVGGFDLQRAIAMDHDLLLRIWQRYGGDAFRTVPDIVSKYYLGGISHKHIYRAFNEVRQNLERILGSKVRGWVAFSILVAKYQISKRLHRV